jgi:hypothetical protein
MVFTRKQKQALTAASNPLIDTGILQQVFTFLPGHHLFLSAVCREWRAVYASMADQQMRTFRLYGNTKHVACGARTTLYSAAVASPATARLACECGVQFFSNMHMQVIAGGYADTQTMAALRELGMPLSESVILAVGLSGRLNILQHLLIEQLCPKHNNLSHYAARSGNISMLNWLRAQGWCVFDQSTCTGAARGGHLAALKHLRSEGCAWRAGSIAHNATNSGSIDTVEWLQQQSIDFDADAMAEAAGDGHTVCVIICAVLGASGMLRYAIRLLGMGMPIHCVG